MAMFAFHLVGVFVFQYEEDDEVRELKSLLEPPTQPEPVRSNNSNSSSNSVVR